LNPQELKEFACFADLSDEEREVFAELLEEVGIETGEEIFREGEEADGLVLVASGCVRLERRGGELGGSVTDGAILGALSLVAPGKREVTAVAETPCRVLWMPRSAYRRIAEDAPRAACRFIEHVLSDLVTLIRHGLPQLLASAVDPSRRAE
jgi:CRP-like cAMP-binding protein